MSLTRAESLAIGRFRQGDLHGGIAALRDLLSERPAEAYLWRNLGVALSAAGQWSEAADALEACLQLDPELKGAAAARARALSKCGRPEDAVVAAEILIAGGLADAEIFSTLGAALSGSGRPDEAADAFARVLDFPGAPAQCLSTAGRFFLENDWESRAADAFERLVRAMPDRSVAWFQRASAELRVGRLEEGIAALERSLQIEPGFQTARMAYLNALVSSDQWDGPALLRVHRSEPMEAPGSWDFRDPERRLRIGILSHELGGGTALYFVPGVIGNLDRSQFSLFAYSSNPAAAPNPVFDEWREVAGMPDAEVRARIRADAIDVMLDISGHLPRNRIDVLARRAAPIQIAYPRYPATTGVAAMDYRFTDRWADPPGESEGHYCERLIYLDGGYLSYQAPECAPPVTPLPALESGQITFGFFQRPIKLNERSYDALAGTVLAVSGSRLLMHYAVGDFDRPGQPARKRIEEAFLRRGVDLDRLIFRGPLPLEEHLRLVAQTDIALDSFPYSGQTTTCECLWMGVPVVTLAGDRFSARVSASLLHRAGLAGWVASTLDEYVAIAAAHASDLQKLATLREGLRARLAASPVMDCARVAREMGAAIRQLWRERCAINSSKSSS